jgi:UDP-N-acetylglucosamine 4,6-dehydratase
MFLARGAQKVGIFSRDEVKQAQMARRFPDPRMRWLLGDVRDRDRLEVATYGYDAIIHAAALKRVDAVADSPSEVFRTNLDGTRNVLSAALSARVPRVLVISSDKACYPTNAYGVSKAAAESETVGWNRYSMPRGVACSVLRYGNVLGSRGSVLHAWKEQTVPEVTHRDMTRFIITLPQACQAVAWALSAMEGGEVFVPVLGSAGILDLLEAATGDRTHRVTGLRPGGEKLHETLLTVEEVARTVDTREGFWAVQPHLHEWRGRPPWAGPTLEGAYPRTSANARPMGVPELRKLLQDVPTEGV